MKSYPVLQNGEGNQGIWPQGEGVSDSRRSMHMDKGEDEVKWKVNQMRAARHKRE